ncbi:MAG: TIGR03862 family flavoprotein [Siculibacillus sp.]|nr:TIGR03862 family flavoprotein [Siculibacillus sp.]
MGAREVVVVGGGPAGLTAAEVIAGAGHHVTVVERMPSIGRKLMMAGRGGLNLTHSEAGDRFLGRYGAAEAFLTPSIAAFQPNDLRDWARGLGEETFVGTSGRVFPCSFKASPLLRAWARRLADLGVAFRTRTRWTGFTPGGVTVVGPAGEETIVADAVVLGLGGASWPRLGSDGAWTSILAAEGVEIVPLRPTNCGFTVAWSEIFRGRFEGEPLKRIAVRFAEHVSVGEAVVTSDGLEGGAIYGLSAVLREAIAAGGATEIRLDLKPAMDAEEIAAALDRGRKGDSLSNRLRKGIGLPPVAVGLLREGVGKDLPADTTELARLIKAVPIRVVSARPLERAISSAGGVALGEIGPDFQLKRLPGVFVCGEMIDWEAPTGGYLLQACFSTGRAAGRGVTRLLET